MKLVLLMALLAADLRAQTKFEPAVIKKQVQPDTANDPSPFVVHTAKVELVLDDHGKPFSLKSDSGLPDNVVEALAQWRFQPARDEKGPIPSAFNLSVPVKRRPSLANALGRHWISSKDAAEAFVAAQKLDPAGVAHLEETIKSGSGTRVDHLTFLAVAKTRSAPEAKQAALREILWLLKNDPKDPVFSATFIVPDPGSSSTFDEYQQIQQIWLTKLKENPKDPQILNHATNFLRFSDPEVVETYTQDSLGNVGADAERSAVFLGDVYGVASLGITALDPMTGLPSDAAAQLPATPFAKKARMVLSQTNDSRILSAGLIAVSMAGASLRQAGHVPAGYADFCQQLLSRALTFNPALKATCDSPALLLASPAALRVTGPTNHIKLLKQVRPVYPLEARSQHIEGTVVFNVVIAKDGSVRSLELTSGFFALYKAAREAALKWEFSKTTVNDLPAEVSSTIEKNFKLK